VKISNLTKISLCSPQYPDKILWPLCLLPIRHRVLCLQGWSRRCLNPTAQSHLRIIRNKYGGDGARGSLPRPSWSISSLRAIKIQVLHPEDGGDTFSETSVLKRSTRCNTLEDIRHCYRRGNITEDTVLRALSKRLHDIAATRKTLPFEQVQLCRGAQYMERQLVAQ
jgi:hypothetical protein